MWILFGIVVLLVAVFFAALWRGGQVLRSVDKDDSHRGR